MGLRNLRRILFVDRAHLVGMVSRGDIDRRLFFGTQARREFPRGMTSPYRKSFLVARVHPIRFRPKDAPPLSFDDALDRMTKAAEKFNPEKIKLDDLVKTGGAPDEGE